MAATALAATSRKWPFLLENNWNSQTPVPMLMKGPMFLLRPPWASTTSW